MPLRLIFSLFCCLALARTLAAQPFPNWDNQPWRWQSGARWGIGGQVGLSFNLGTHSNRIGIIAKVFGFYDFLQINAQALGNYTFRNWGAQQKGWELQLRAGIVGAWGRRDSLTNPYLNEISNQTGRRFSVGYAYVWYLDTWKTSQRSGTFGFQLWDFRLVMENDFLSLIPQDRYRTGALGVYYWLRQTNTQLGLHHISWTGDPYGENANWVRKKDTDFPSRFGYIDTYHAPYGRFSNGILGLDIEQQLPFFQYAHVAIGIDAEQIRNAMQNRLVHDNPVMTIFNGEYDRGTNPHIPMICIDGTCFLYKPEQKIRPARFYFQLRGNSTLFY